MICRTFKPLSLAHREPYQQLLSAMPHKASDYTFGNLWAWAEEHGLSLLIEPTVAFIMQTRPKRMLWAPVGSMPAEVLARHPVVRGHFAKGLPMIRVPAQLAEELAAALGPDVEAVEAREHWDYVYDAPELVSLAGNRFHKKKNLFNQFVKSYAFDFHELTGDCVEEVLNMQQEWCKWRGGECFDSSLAAENRAIERVLTSFDELPDLIGGVITVDGKTAAYTVAEPLSQDTVVIHFEKGHTSFKGIYQAVNKLFLEKIAPSFAFVNREQDLGEEGLRKAKLSYNPVRFVEKCTLLPKTAQAETTGAGCETTE